MYCKNCGKEIHDEAVMCVHCGATVASIPAEAAVSSEDYAPGGICFLCFLIPFFGLMLYATHAIERPRAASAYLKWAVISWVICLIAAGIYIGILLAENW